VCPHSFQAAATVQDSSRRSGLVALDASVLGATTEPMGRPLGTVFAGLSTSNTAKYIHVKDHQLHAIALVTNAEHFGRIVLAELTNTARGQSVRLNAREGSEVEPLVEEEVDYRCMTHRRRHDSLELRNGRRPEGGQDEPHDQVR